MICFRLNADLNAARNIVLKHLEAQSASDQAEVNQPIVTGPTALVANSGAGPLSN